MFVRPPPGGPRTLARTAPPQVPPPTTHTHLDTPYKSSEVGAASVSQDVGHCDLECLCRAPAPRRHYRLQNTGAPEVSFQQGKKEHPSPHPSVPRFPESGRPDRSEDGWEGSLISKTEPDSKTQAPGGPGRPPQDKDSRGKEHITEQRHRVYT